METCSWVKSRIKCSELYGTYGEAILAHGCERSIKEFMTVKSDWTEGKRDFLRQLIEAGRYELPEDNQISSQTKQVVDVQIDFLKS